MKTIMPKSGIFLALLFMGACSFWNKPLKVENRSMPGSFRHGKDTQSLALPNWRNYFQEPELIELIDSALSKNQELNILIQDIEIARNEVRMRKGEYLPSVGAGISAGADKPGRYTRSGAVEDQLEIKPGKPFPEPLTDVGLAAVASWEVDIWKRLRNARKSAMMRYLATTEGRNFMTTRLVAEVAETFYELKVLDNQKKIVEQNAIIQSNALRIVQQQKESAKVSQLAVNRFEAQYLNTKNLIFSIDQQIAEAENKLHFLTGSYSIKINRNADDLLNENLVALAAGLPSQLIVNRPDVRKAELELKAAKLDIQVARAKFLPSLSLRAALGFQAYAPGLLLEPHSLLYQTAGDLMAPLVNRNALKAELNVAHARQEQAVLVFEQSLLQAFFDVRNQLAKMDNFDQSFQTKSKEVDILMQSVQIANSLFNSARADYAEVLLTQREALESKMQLVEIKKQQLDAKVGIYRALGGGWN